MRFTLAEIARQIRGEVVGDVSVEITGAASAETARPGDITFAEKQAYLALAEESAAAAVIVSGALISNRKPLIRVGDARVAMARLLPLFFPPDDYLPGIHSSAVADPSAYIHPTACIGPGCVIERGARIGARTVLRGGNHIGRDARVGDDVCLFPNVIIYARSQIGDRVSIHAGSVIGSDGYGYVFDEGRHRKVLQVGHVVIEEDVEIGANAAIDRGAFGRTLIGAGTKIDNLVHIAHNVSIGRHCLVMGQVGFAGSTRLGDYCVIASQSGIAGHLTLGRQSTVGAKSGVMRDIPEGGTVLGIPAMPDKQMKRQWIGMQQLPAMIRRLRELEQQVADLRQKLPQDAAEPDSSVVEP